MSEKLTGGAGTTRLVELRIPWGVWVGVFKWATDCHDSAVCLLLLAGEEIASQLHWPHSFSVPQLRPGWGQLVPSWPSASSSSSAVLRRRGRRKMHISAGSWSNYGTHVGHVISEQNIRPGRAGQGRGVRRSNLSGAQTWTITLRRAAALDRRPLQPV